jgi:hypothetical protein
MLMEATTKVFVAVGAVGDVGVAGVVVGAVGVAVWAVVGVARFAPEALQAPRHRVRSEVKFGVCEDLTQRSE